MTGGRFADCRSSRRGCVKVRASSRATKEANLAGRLSERNGHLRYDKRPLRRLQELAARLRESAR
jgi:hypothetical protein